MFMFNYKEAPEVGNDYRKAYRDGIDKLIEEKYNAAEQKRWSMTKEIAQNPDKYRERFKELLGWPLVGNDDLSYDVKKEFVTEDNGIKIYRVQIITLGGLPFYGMLFLSDESADTPMVIANHGGLGAPELCSGLLEIGTINYHNMVERLLQYKVNVFAPQYLNWNTERFKIAEENMERRADYSMRQARDLKLKQLGSSITAIEIFGVQRAIDWLIDSGTCREDKIGMTGLSYGGFYTLFITAIDTRIKAAASFCFYSDMKVKTDRGFSDWIWKGAANSFFDSQVLALICPRKIDIFMGDKDELFNIEVSKGEFEKFKSSMGELADYASFTAFDGTHEVIKDDDSVFIRLTQRINENK